MWHLVWYCFGFWLLDWFFVWCLFQIILIMNKVQRLVNNQVEIHLIVKVHSLRKINDVPFYQFYSFWNVCILSKRFLNLTLAVRLYLQNFWCIQSCISEHQKLCLKSNRQDSMYWNEFYLFCFDSFYQNFEYVHF